MFSYGIQYTITHPLRVRIFLFSTYAQSYGAS